MSDDVRIDLSLEGENPVAIKTMLEEAGARQVGQSSEKGLTGIEISLFAIMALQALTNLVIRLSPLLQSGMIIDARGPRMRIRKEKGLPRGGILVLTKKGEKSTLHEPSETKLLALLRQDGTH